MKPAAWVGGGEQRRARRSRSRVQSRSQSDVSALHVQILQVVPASYCLAVSRPLKSVTLQPLQGTDTSNYSPQDNCSLFDIRPQVLEALGRFCRLLPLRLWVLWEVCIQALQVQLSVKCVQTCSRGRGWIDSILKCCKRRSELCVMFLTGWSGRIHARVEYSASLVEYLTATCGSLQNGLEVVSYWHRKLLWRTGVPDWAS